MLRSLESEPACPQVMPGATPLTQICRYASSRAAHFMNMLTIALEILNVAYPGAGRMPAEAERIVIEPKGLMKFTQSEAVAKTLLMLTAIILSHSFKLVSLTVPCCIIPWQIKTPSIRPSNLTRACLILASRFSGSNKKSCLIVYTDPL